MKKAYKNLIKTSKTEQYQYQFLMIRFNNIAPWELGSKQEQSLGIFHKFA